MIFCAHVWSYGNPALVVFVQKALAQSMAFNAVMLEELACHQQRLDSQSLSLHKDCSQTDSHKWHGAPQLVSIDSSDIHGGNIVCLYHAGILK